MTSLGACHRTILHQRRCIVLRGYAESAWSVKRLRGMDHQEISSHSFYAVYI